MTRRHTGAALAAAFVALAALAGCAKDYGVPENIAGGYNGGGLEGLTGNGCYLNPNAAPPNDGAVVITLDAATKFQTMQGFGSSMRLFDDPRVTNTLDPATKRATAIPSETQQNQILDALYLELGLSRVRFLPADDGGIEPANDNADPLVADPTKFDFSWAKSDGQIELMPGLIRRGVTTWFASPPVLEKWMTEANPEEYAEWAMVMLRHWRDRGLEMPYYSLKNEPGVATSSAALSAQYLLAVTKLLGARIKAEGLKTKLVLPDDVDPRAAYARLQVILADPDARQYLGAVAYHLRTAGGESEIERLAEQYGIPIWMTGYSAPGDFLDLAKIMHELIANDGVSAFDFAWGFFGDFDSSQLVRLNVRNGAFDKFDITQQYYTMGQYSRFVRPGAVRIAATSSDPNVLATAYVDGYKLIVVATFLGPGFFERLVRVELGSGGPCVRRVDALRTSASDSWLATPTARTDVPRFSAKLPARSITTFVGQQ